MKLTNLSLPYIKERHRLILWFLLISLTALIWFFPTHVSYEYTHYAVPFVHIFNSLPLFGAIYYIWLLLLLALLFSKSDKKEASDWERAALVGIFALVFSGFGALLTHSLFGDAFTPAADIKNFTEQGGFVSASGIKYHGFPAFAILGTGVCQITGLNIIDYISLFPIFQILLFSTLLYLLFRKSLDNPYLASLGVLLVIQGNMYVSTTLSGFHAGAFAPFLLLTTLLLLLARQENRIGLTKYTLLCITLATLAFSHFVTAVVFLMIIIGLYAVQKFGKKPLIPLWFVIILLVIPTTWIISQQYSLIMHFVTVFYKAMEQLFAGQMIGSWLLPLQTTSYVGERAPMWASISWYLWPLLTVILGGVLGLKKLANVRNLDSSEVMELGGLLGISVMTLIWLFLGGIQESYGRTLIYVAFFTVPIMLRWIFKFKAVARRYGLVMLAILFISLSLSSFLANPKGILNMAYHPYELASGEFLESSIGAGERILVYGLGGSAYYLTYYTAKAQMNECYYPSFRSKNEQDIWQDVNEYISTFENSSWLQGDRILVFSSKWDAPFRDFLGIDPKSSLQWSQLKSRLAKNNMIYNNAFIQLYHSSP